MKNGSAAKRSAEPAARVKGRSAPELAPEVLAAPLVSISISAIDSPMWPIHPAGWLQPEAPASAPSWSGLNIERRNRFPAPDLVHFPLAAFDRPMDREDRPQALESAPSPRIPISDLAPLGWDPRAFCPKKESQ